MKAQRLEAIRTTDVRLLRSLLRQDGVANGYLLGDLDANYFGQCRWFVATSRRRPVSVLVVFEGLSTPALLSYGAPDGVGALVRDFSDELPATCWAKIPLEHQKAYATRYHIEDEDLSWVMGLTPDVPCHVEETDGVERMAPQDVAELMTLYEAYPGHFFEPGQLGSGRYFGRRVRGRLVSVAGTHVFAPGEGVAVLGNVVTAPDERGQGHAQACVRRLVQTLRDNGCTAISLQVSDQNAPAIACYRHVGFAFRAVVLQARCRSREA